MLYMIVKMPKVNFRKSHQVLIKIIEAENKVGAMKESGFVTDGRRSEYNAPECCKVELGKELDF